MGHRLDSELFIYAAANMSWKENSRSEIAACADTPTRMYREITDEYHLCFIYRTMLQHGKVPSYTSALKILSFESFTD